MTAQEAKELAANVNESNKPKVYSDEENNNLQEFYFYIRKAAEKGARHCN